VPGSRIILDGLVYLLDDGSIKGTDLYRAQPTNAKKSKKATSNTYNQSAAQRVTSTSNRQSNNLDKAKQKKLHVEPSLTGNAVSVYRNSVSGSIPLEVDKPSTAASNDFSVLDRASERNQVLRSGTTQKPAAVILKPKPITDLATIRKSDILPSLPAATGLAEPIEGVALQAEDDSEKIAEPIESQVSTVSGDLTSTEDNTSASQVGLLSALQVPSSARKDNDRFSYLEALPVSFDVGGSGFMLKGSTESHSKFHYVGRIGVTDTYQEALLGAGYYVTPNTAGRFTVVLQAGVEYGSFSLDDDQNSDITAELTDTGLYFGAGTRFVVHHRFELKAGLGYSTFFDGDLMVFGGAYWQVAPRLDLVSQFELGDNDLVGLGIRYYY